VIPNKLGRVLNPETGEPLTGDYVVGWIKRGPSGVIGTNKPDSVETVNMLLEDADKLPAPEQADPEAIEALIRARKPECVSFHDWLTLDQIEQANGAPASRPRVKFSRVQEMLEAIKAAKATAK
jgi:ferredoxin/flavodoxin---NADP+ reductase